MNFATTTLKKARLHPEICITGKSGNPHPGNPYLRKSAPPEIRTSRNPYLQKSVPPEIRASRNSHPRKTVHPEIHTSGNPHVWKSAPTQIPKSGNPYLRKSVLNRYSESDPESVVQYFAPTVFCMGSTGREKLFSWGRRFPVKTM